MKYAIIASTFSGNKGAASMLEASIQTITKKDKNAEFSVLTIYPEADKEFNKYENVELFNAKPLYLGLVINPLSLLYKIIPPMRGFIKRNRAVRAIAEADVLLDQGGITFVNGRTKFLIYNVASILPGFFTNTKVIKCSQAMGPFTGINKFVAKLILPKVDTICARGLKTRIFLDELGLKNVVDSTDYAFLMEISKVEANLASKLLENNGFKKQKNCIGLLPSEVVRKKAEKNGEDYIEFNRKFIKNMLGDGKQVVLMAYSAREGKDSRHNNDLPVCRAIAEGINDKNFLFLDQEISAQQLRHIIGKMDIVVTSRFHAMIAALSMNVPPVVVGWSHKYAEIMEMFDMEDLAMGLDKLSSSNLSNLTLDTIKRRDKLSKNISNNLPLVVADANKQVEIICRR